MLRFEVRGLPDANFVPPEIGDTKLASGLDRRPDQPEGGPRIRHLLTNRPH